MADRSGAGHEASGWGAPAGEARERQRQGPSEDEGGEKESSLRDHRPILTAGPRSGPDAPVDPDDVEPGPPVGEPDLAPFRGERGLGHREVAGVVAVLESRLGRRHEIGDLLRLSQPGDVEDAEARGDERAGDDLRVHPGRDVAVVTRVPLDRARRAGVAGRGGVALGLVDLEAEVRDDAPTAFSLPSPVVPAVYSSNSST